MLCKGMIVKTLVNSRARHWIMKMDSSLLVYSPPINPASHPRCRQEKKPRTFTSKTKKMEKKKQKGFPNNGNQ